MRIYPHRDVPAKRGLSVTSLHWTPPWDLWPRGILAVRRPEDGAIEDCEVAPDQTGYF